jgi:murein endopeptidase
LRDQFPDVHVLAIGDLSAEHGGPITEHHSHQSGRDADLGLIYNEVPQGFPQNFVRATEDNLDAEATLALVRELADTAADNGGVQVMFLDFQVQGILYRWAKQHGVDEDTLDHLFQYPHGRGASEGLVRHEPNHDNHLHVRFKCPRGDSACR